MGSARCQKEHMGSARSRRTVAAWDLRDPTSRICVIRTRRLSLWCDLPDPAPDMGLRDPERIYGILTAYMDLRDPCRGSAASMEHVRICVIFRPTDIYIIYRKQL